MKKLIEISENFNGELSFAEIGFIFSVSQKRARELEFNKHPSKYKHDILNVNKKATFTISEVGDVYDYNSGIPRPDYTLSTIAQLNMRLYQYLKGIPASRKKQKDKSFKYPSINTVVTDLLVRFSTIEQRDEVIGIVSRSKFDPSWESSKRSPVSEFVKSHIKKLELCD